MIKLTKKIIWSFAVQSLLLLIVIISKVNKIVLKIKKHNMLLIFLTGFELTENCCQETICTWAMTTYSTWKQNSCYCSVLQWKHWRSFIWHRVLAKHNILIQWKNSYAQHTPWIIYPFLWEARFYLLWK